LEFVSVYPTILIGLVTAGDEFLLVVLDADNVLPATGKGKGASSLVKDEDVEVAVYGHLAV
jgi:hypothetical protein